MAQLTSSYQKIAETNCGTGGGTTVYIRLYAKLNSQSIANNTSSVSLQSRLYFSGSLTTSAVKSTIDGTTITVASGSKSYSRGEYTLQTVNRTITHGSSGSSGTITKKCSWSSYYTAVNGSTSGSFTLPTIPRQATITSAPNFNDEQNPTIKYSNPAGNSATTLQVCISLDGSKADIAYRNVSKTGTSYTFNLTEAERNILRNATTSNSRSVRFYIMTVLGGNTYRTYVSKTFSIINGNPIFSDFSYKDTNNAVVSITGNNQVLVKGVSTLQATISVENKMISQKGATAKNYNAVIDNVNKNVNYSETELNIDLGTISSSGIKRLNIRAYDSRNNSTLVYKDITVYDYDKPIIDANINRINNFESECVLNVSGKYSSLLIDGINKNELQSLQYRYCEKSGTWSNWTNINYTISENNFSCDDITLILDNNKSFDIEIKATDKLDSTIVPLNVGIGQAIFFISTNKKECYVNGKQILVEDDTGWIDITLESGIAEETAGLCGTPQYRKVGNQVFLKGGVSYTATTSGITFGRLPSNLVPSKIIYKMAPTGGARVGRIFVQTDGRIACDWIYNLDGSGRYTGSVTWLDINMNYFIDEDRE